MTTIKSQKYKIFGNRFGTGDNPNFFTAVREIRSLTNCGLKEAKDAYDGITPMYFIHVKDGSQNSIYQEKRLQDIQDYGCNVALESVSGCKIDDKDLEERYRIRAKNALKRYVKKLIDNDRVQHAQEILNTLVVMK